MKWHMKRLELNPEQIEGTESIELPEGAILLTTNVTKGSPGFISGQMYYMEPDPAHMGSCQVIGCLEDATVDRKFECFRVKLCPKHGEEFGPKKEED